MLCAIQFSFGYSLGPVPVSTPRVAGQRSAVPVMAADDVTVGVLAIQGAFKEHMDALNRQPGVNAIEVRTAAQLAEADALILPGGESTAQGHGLVDAELLEPVKDFLRMEKPVWGVCAGMILLADSLDGGAAQPLIGGLNVQVKRNAFGRQIYSRVLKMELQNSAVDLGATQHFIRAPEVTSVEEGVEVLAKTADGRIAAVQQGPLMATCFHPEVSGDDSWLQHFLGTVFEAKGVAQPTTPAEPVPDMLAAAPWNYMPEVGPGTNYPDGALSLSVKRAFAVFQKGGVIMDVVDGEQARIAEAAGAVAVMALERIPADIKADGGVARSSDPSMIKDVMASCSIPVMAKARIGHFAEAQVLEALEVDCIDESEVLTAADEANHIYKRPFAIPFVCGAQNLGEALRRIAEGACMIRLKGNAGTGNVIQAVRHARSVFSEIRQLQSLREDEIFKFAKDLQVPVELVEQVRLAGRLPVVTFAAGGLATPADVSMLMQLGCDGVFVGSGIFKGEHPAQRARAMVAACTHYQDPLTVARVSEGLGKAMVGLLEHEDPVAVSAMRAQQARAEGVEVITGYVKNGGIDPAVKA